MAQRPPWRNCLGLEQAAARVMQPDAELLAANKARSQVAQAMMRELSEQGVPTLIAKSGDKCWLLAAGCWLLAAGCVCCLRHQLKPTRTRQPVGTGMSGRAQRKQQRF